MLLEIIWKKPIFNILYELIKAGRMTYFSANELSRRTHLSVPTVVDAIEQLISLRLVEVIKHTETREYVRIAELNPLLPIIEEFINVSRDYEEYLSRRILSHIDEILDEHYFIGMFWAAFQGVDPIDYNPRIFVIYTKKLKRILPLTALSSLYVSSVDEWNPPLEKETLIGVINISEFPIDITTTTVFSTEVKVTSIERGIAQCFSKRNIFYPPYAAALAFVQNLDLNRITEEKLVAVSSEENVLPIIKAVAYYLEQRLQKKFFDVLTENVEKIASTIQAKNVLDFSWGRKPDSVYAVDDSVVAIDSNILESAITTVFG
ncbi:MAG: hypothetical protein ACP6IU_01680 [Candidatus Asgardarchaeia archaeon]